MTSLRSGVKMVLMKKIKIQKKKLKKGLYRGEILKGKPNGYGIFIKYDDNERWKAIGMPTQINEIYLGEWKDGEYNGKGRLIGYSGLEWGSDKDDMPLVIVEERGNFKEGRHIEPYYYFTQDEPKKWTCYETFHKNGEFTQLEIKNKKFQKPGSFTVSEVAMLLGIDLNKSKKILGAELKRKYKIDVKAKISLKLLHSLVQI